MEGQRCRGAVGGTRGELGRGAGGVYLAHRETGLGDLLPAEAGLFLVPAAAAGRRKSRRLAPAALRRSVLLELTGLTAVVVLWALLAGTPPPGR
ncbi:hypothetical protein [Actinacidiphila bryophytorum]|uniref:Uncharacterized protein n=1 Tax=Actinacidiphila bryophytorum TaxID=1436133 RepID=A0A9W4H3N8_9ACTN|nr:hypothetical protein [Actinacidiphila bryophytorum]MBM9439873.1 hypothetical protein [Actinacidiphila bryophytorum]MBN6542791.1 hypothetical protein [Actinacidiphila bryophytorum]CAG7648313.1 hypothetical protein SBRY_40900 [Actinacidiphila bryophytorum]